MSKAPAPTVPNYLVPAILTTIFCCPPFGIASIVFAARVNSKLQEGDYQGAVDASRSAKTWAWVSGILGVIAGVISIIFVLLGMFAAWRLAEQNQLQPPPQAVPVQPAPPQAAPVKPAEPPVNDVGR